MNPWFHKRRALKISTPYFILLLSGCLATCLTSCNLINPEEGIPAYLKVDTFSFTATQGQGSSSNRITDVWAFNDGQIAGAFEMPVTFPVLDSGSTEMVLSPGIWDNGISETRVIYPFYYPDTVTLNLEPAKTYTVVPHFTYRSNTKFYFIEDFEAGNIFAKVDGDTAIIRTSNPDEVFEGATSAAIHLDKDHNYFEGRTSAGYGLSEGEPVYLELNYRCDQPFQVGIYASVSGIEASLYKWTINPKSYWNKIYLNMGYDIGQLQADKYQIQIKATYDESQTTTHIYLDNIKLVSY